MVLVESTSKTFSMSSMHGTDFDWKMLLLYYLMNQHQKTSDIYSKNQTSQLCQPGPAGMSAFGHTPDYSIHTPLPHVHVSQAHFTTVQIHNHVLINSLKYTAICVYINISVIYLQIHFSSSLWHQNWVSSARNVFQCMKKNECKWIPIAFNSLNMSSAFSIL